MPVVFQMTDDKFLQKIGVPEHIRSVLTAFGVKVVLGKQTIEFRSSAGKSMAGMNLSMEVAEVAKGALGSEYVAADIAAFIESEVIPQLKAVNLAPAPVVFGSKAKPVVGSPQAPIPLRDATELYQRVRGTANHNYFVIAISADLKIAVKIEGMSVSMRAEWKSADFATQVALAKAGMTAKALPSGGKYASAHIACTPEAPPEKVIGAMLFATELDFQTEFPSVAHVRKLMTALGD